MKKVYYLIRNDNYYLAYPETNKDIVYWDEEYRTKEEFEEKYKDYEKEEIQES